MSRQEGTLRYDLMLKNVGQNNSMRADPRMVEVTLRRVRHRAGPGTPRSTKDGSVTLFQGCIGVLLTSLRFDQSCAAGVSPCHM